ncbi:MAG: FFLEELY motif protein [Arenimonas sp.]
MNPALRRCLTQRIAWQRRLSDPATEPRNRLPTLSPLRRWQAERLKGSFTDLLASPSMRPAAQFFLSDLYGDQDFTGRDRDAARILPLMARILPEALLQAACDAIELGVLSHAFDLRMAQALAKRRDPMAPITDADYATAYREVGLRRLRAHQIDLIEKVGVALDAGVHRHGVHRLLRASRLPAQLAGLAQLQRFLERGFDAFAKLGGAGPFLGLITGREREISRRLFAGQKAPFDVG